MKILALSLILLISFSVFAKSKVNYSKIQCPSAKAIAQHFMAGEAAGYRHLGKTSCSKRVEKKTKAFMKYRPNSISEKVLKSELKVLPSTKSLKVLSVKTSKSDPSVKVVKFKARLANKKTVIDTMSFTYFDKPNTSARGYMGCAAIAGSPKYYYVAKSCLK